MGDVGPVGLEEVAEVLSERLRFLRAEPPAHRWGRVFVGSIEEARGREFGVVFLPGLAEGLFPQRMLEDPLLLDELREAVSADLPLRKQRVSDERMLLHLAVAAARDRLVVSYPRMEVAEARPRVPSFYALELPRAIEGSLPELKAFEDRAREAAPARLNWPAPKEAASAIDDAEFDLVTIVGRTRSALLSGGQSACGALSSRTLDPMETVVATRRRLDHGKYHGTRSPRPPTIDEARLVAFRAREFRGVPLQVRAAWNLPAETPRRIRAATANGPANPRTLCFTKSNSSCFRICRAPHCCP